MAEDLYLKLDGSRHLMSPKFLTEFIDLYRQSKCLWDQKDKHYRCKSFKRKEYNKLINKMKEVVPHANIYTVIAKINSLRAVYRREVRRIQSSMKNEIGEIYTPNLWYYSLLTFLDEDSHIAKPKVQNRMKKRQSSTTNANDATELFTVNDSSNDDSANAIEWDDDSNHEFEDRGYKIPKFEPAETVTIIEDSGKHDSIEFVDSKRKTSGVPSTDIYSHVNTVSLYDNGPTTANRAFGVYISEQLSSLPKDMNLFCRKVINEAILQAEMGNLTIHSRIVNT